MAVDSLNLVMVGNLMMADNLAVHKHWPVHLLVPLY